MLSLYFCELSTRYQQLRRFIWSSQEVFQLNFKFQYFWQISTLWHILYSKEVGGMEEVKCLDEDRAIKENRELS